MGKVDGIFCWNALWIVTIPAYTQDTKSRMSCNLNHLLTVGLDMKRVRDQKENLADQIKDMEAMLKHQKNEIEDLEVSWHLVNHFIHVLHER